MLPDFTFTTFSQNYHRINFQKVFTVKTLPDIVQIFLSISVNSIYCPITVPREWLRIAVSLP